MESNGAKAWHVTPWSTSKLKMLDKCSLQWYLQYHLKLDHEDKNDTVARDQGTTLHAIFEWMMEGYTIQEAYDKAEDFYLDIVKPENWDLIRDNLKNVHKFNRMMHDREEATPMRYVVPEMKLAINRDYEPVDFFADDAYFRGVVDYTQRTVENKSVVIDYKKGGGGFLTRYHTPQLNGYLVLDYYANEPFDFGSSYIYYVEAGELSRGPQIGGEMIETHTRPWLDNSIQTTIDTVYSDGLFKHKRGNHCKYCKYADLCKGGKRGTAGELVKYAEESKELL